MTFRGALLSIFKEIFSTALISLAIFFIVYIFLVQPHRVKGESMLPNFKDGELLLTEKVTYRIYQPTRGDVVVFKAPGMKRVDFIKRIVGLPGENVKILNGNVYINDQELKEPYETQKTVADIDVNLGENQFFVLGDNRNASSDSRVFGPIPKGSITGKAWFVYWPVIKSDSANGARIISRVDYGVPDSFYNR